MNTNNTTLENNILIAGFMGGEYRENLPYEYTKSGWFKTPANDGRHIVQSYDFKYHSSWNWLMPVVEKIEGLDFHNLSFTFDIHKDIVIINAYGETVINTIPFNSHTSLIEIDFKNSKIETVYNAVIEFVKWYNATNIANSIDVDSWSK